MSRLNVTRMMHKLLSIILFFYIVPFAQADHVVLKNGDKLTGNIKLVQDGKVLIETEYSGVVTIEGKKVKSFSIAGPVKIQKKLFSQGTFLDSIGISEDSSIVLVSKADTRKVPINNNLILIKKSKSGLQHYDFLTNGALNLSAYYNQTTTKTTQYTVDGYLNIKYDLWRHKLYGSLYKGETDLKPITDYYTAQYEIDGFLYPSIFWQGSTQFKRDYLSNIKSKLSVGMGPGWQLWEDELSALSLTGLVNYQLIDYRVARDLVQPTWLIKWNYYQFFAFKNFKFYTLGQIGRGFTDAITFDFSATAGIIHKFTSWLSLNASITKELNTTFDGSTERINYTLGIGVTW